MPLRLNGLISGSVELKAPSVAGTAILELPTDSIKPAMTLLMKQSFSAASSVSVNNCFSADYDNYKIVFENCTQTTAAWAGIRFRAGGVDAATGYVGAAIDRAGGGLGVMTASATELRWTWADYHGGGMLDVIDPYLARPTSVVMNMIGANSGTVWSVTGAGMLQNTSLYDGFTLIPGGAYTLTGSLSVYGYRKDV